MGSASLSKMIIYWRGIYFLIVVNNRVHTDPGKVWKVLDFNVEIFKALKSLENDHRYGNVWKILENCNDDLENADVYYTVDYRCIC